MNSVPNFEADDLDWVLGELYHLTDVAVRLKLKPHELDRCMFEVCMRIVNSYPLATRLDVRDDLDRLLGFKGRRASSAHALTH